MSARSREFRINFNHDDLLRCENAGVNPAEFVNDTVRAALAELPDPSEEGAPAEEEEASTEEETTEDEEDDGTTEEETDEPVATDA